MSHSTGKQKRELRARGHALPAAMTFVRPAISEASKRELSAMLDKRELVKVRLAAGPPAERRKQAEELALWLGADLVGSVGRTVLLYRPSEGNDAERRAPGGT